MTARAIGSATISFGMVSVPVKLYSTAESGRDISFNLLHEGCGTKLKQQYYCPSHDRVVSRDEMVKGYQFARDQYVTFSAEELRALAEQVTNAIEIDAFLPIDKIDPIYFETPYFLGPDKGGERAYRLLVQAMQETGRAGLARYAARGKQYLVMVRPHEDALVMQQLRYADEVKSVGEVPSPEVQVKPNELDLARQLIEQISTDRFQPEQYQDDVRQRLQEAIEQKVEGKEITAPPAPPRRQVIDLMEALKASVQQRAGAGTHPSEAAPRRKPHKRVGAARAATRRGEKKASR